VGADNRDILIIEVLGVPDLELGPRLLLPARGLVRIRPGGTQIEFNVTHKKSYITADEGFKKIGAEVQTRYDLGHLKH
jgi:hypothetical protein